MEKILLWILAAGAFIGGIDRILGNRLGLGKRFEEGFHLLGPSALSMAGILCLSPLISEGISRSLARLWRFIGFDPAMLGGLLPIDMGGYQMAVQLADDPGIGLYAGILVSATLGCTLAFTVPMGMGMLDKKDAPFFSKGILTGLAAMPLALLIGGAASGLSLPAVLWETLPVLLFSVILMLCIRFAPQKSIAAFTWFSRLIRLLSLGGLIVGAVQYISGTVLLPSLMPLEEAMQVVSSIGIVMLGSLPAAELLRRALSKPFRLLGKRLGMSDLSFSGLLVCFVSVTPALNMIGEMDDRGKVMNAAFAVCGASALAAHLGFTAAIEKSMMLPLLLTKLSGALMAAALALLMTKKPSSAR